MGLIRLLLAVSVLITHSAPVFGVRLLNGDAAIICFFIISGFLMALILNEKYSDRKKFYLNRFLRIYPPFLAAMLFSFALYYVAGSGKHDPIKTLRVAWELRSYELFVWGIISNLTLVGADLTRYILLDGDTMTYRFPNFLYGGGGGGQNLLAVPQSWTLPLELYFYALAPLVIRWSTRKLIACTVFFLLLRNLVFVAMRRHFQFDDIALFPLNIQYFLLGAVGYRFYAWYSNMNYFTEILKRKMAIGAYGIALGLIFFGLMWLQTATRMGYDIFYVVFAATVPFQFYLMRNSKLDAALGEYSYPIYLFHYGITITVVTFMPQLWYGELTLGITLLVSFLYLRFFDRHIQMWRSRIAAKARP